MLSRASLLKDRFLVLCLLVLAACQPQEDTSAIVDSWLFKLDLGETSLPFNAEIIDKDGKLIFYALNGEERIRADNFKFGNDSFYVQLPVFNTALIGRLHNDTLKGFFHDYSRSGNYKIPLIATKKFQTRFPAAEKPMVQVDGKWKVEFSPGSDNEYQALGQFSTVGNKAYGTFLTTTGDYRFLEGNVSGDSLLLSCFDGAHAFLFKGHIKDDKVEGEFWSGNHWKENWQGVRDETFELPDPTSLTFLKPGFDRIEFSFNDLNGNAVSIDDKEYNDKVVIVQIMGSWCPNCKDETAYLISLYNQFHDKGLEVVALAFEKSDNQETNYHSLQRMIDHFSIPYKVLLAGNASKTEAAEKLPMLNHVLSFPTTIYIDRSGKVRKIHTGFAGPGTGEYYHEFVEQSDKFVTQLLIE